LTAGGLPQRSAISPNQPHEHRLRGLRDKRENTRSNWAGPVDQLLFA
jgi:hypothetical protein